MLDEFDKRYTFILFLLNDKIHNILHDVCIYFYFSYFIFNLHILKIQLKNIWQQIFISILKNHITKFWQQIFISILKNHIKNIWQQIFISIYHFQFDMVSLCLILVLKKHYLLCVLYCCIVCSLTTKNTWNYVFLFYYENKLRAFHYQ
jgi:hypothetical protein